MRDTEFVNGEYYHIYLRGVDKRTIFCDVHDYSTFAESLYLFNDSNYQHRGDPYDKIAKITGTDIFGIDRDPFVSIVSWTLLPNHYHLFVRQEQDNGISRFLHKVNKGYSWSFNRRNHRTGTLFEGRFHAKHINNNQHFDHMVIYTHLNILDLTEHNWRDGEITDWSCALIFMDGYEWSSHQFFNGKGQQLPIVSEEIVKDIFTSPHDYLSVLKAWTSRNMIKNADFSLPGSEI